MSKFATYLHPHTCYTSQQRDRVSFVGYSFPYFSKVRQNLAKLLQNYPTLPIKKAQYTDYLRVHTEDYLRTLALMALNQPVNQLPKLSGECQNLEYCLPGYLYGLGGMLEAIDTMKKGSLERAYCFSLPGHHAYANSGHGYCLLNPLAAAARYAQTQGFDRILIIDWDIHHGDGTQSIFSNDKSVYCISIHSAVDIYMAKASDLILGTTTVGDAIGHCNIPILIQSFPVEILASEGLTGTFYQGEESLDIFADALSKIPWQPDLILIFSGYDSHKDDCGKNITNWTNSDFQRLTQIVLDFAKKNSCPVLSSHGGGYNLSVTLSAAVSHVEVLANY
ncbi:MAG: histone deacetylase family protein [Microcoleaceae cyanobacterium]